MPYSLPKQDHFVVPGYYRAMENWGVIGYSENIIDNKTMDYLNTNVIFHEVVVSFHLKFILNSKNSVNKSLFSFTASLFWKSCDSQMVVKHVA